MMIFDSDDQTYYEFIGYGGLNIFSSYGFCYVLSDVFDVFLGFGINFPIHLKIGIGTHGPILGGQVSNMTIAGQHSVIAAQILINRFRLGRRLDDDNLCHDHFFLCLKFANQKKPVAN